MCVYFSFPVLFFFFNLLRHTFFYASVCLSAFTSGVFMWPRSTHHKLQNKHSLLSNLTKGHVSRKFGISSKINHGLSLNFLLELDNMIILMTHHKFPTKKSTAINAICLIDSSYIFSRLVQASTEEMNIRICHLNFWCVFQIPLPNNCCFAFSENWYDLFWQYE